MSTEKKLPSVNDPIWMRLADFVAEQVDNALQSHPKLGDMLTYREGAVLSSKLAMSITYGIHKRLDDEYDT